MDRREWLEADGLGGYASGTVSGPRTRRYHALLLVARQPPTDRVVLVNGFDAWVETPSGRYAISTQRYAGDVLSPDGHARLVGFEREPWPRWTFALEDGTRVVQELLAWHGRPLTALSWKLKAGPARMAEAMLVVRPFLSGRDHHALHHENGALRFDADVSGERVGWRTYASVPPVAALTNGAYAHEPHWCRGFLYEEERARGLDHVEDLAAPGTLRFDLAYSEAVLLLSSDEALLKAPARSALAALRAEERRRRSALGDPLRRAADAYVVRRGAGRTIVAGYPWFTDWGRDTFIALRGLCLATGRTGVAREILLEWSRAVSQGMLPNRFPDRGGQPEFNAADASLWFVVAVAELLQAPDTSVRERARLLDAVKQILEGYARGTRHGIRADADGLLAAGEPGVPLTWMDVKLGDWAVTPRAGKPVEVQALWLNALSLASAWWPRFGEPFARGREAFRARFWDARRGYLADVVDVDHVAGTVDATFRPNQILAVGGLPVALLEGAPARAVVDAVESRLLTPLGLRSLAPGEPGYTPRYEGGVAQRDPAYHRGTVWPWLMGPFVDAWVRVRDDTEAVRQEARRRFVLPLRSHLDDAGLGHVTEIADAEPPHTPRGAPFQAWSLGELLRMEKRLLV